MSDVTIVDIEVIDHEQAMALSSRLIARYLERGRVIIEHYLEACRERDTEPGMCDFFCFFQTVCVTQGIFGEEYQGLMTGLVFGYLLREMVTTP